MQLHVIQKNSIILTKYQELTSYGRKIFIFIFKKQKLSMTIKKPLEGLKGLKTSAVCHIFLH
jgi:hypothetical protein